MSGEKHMTKKVPRDPEQETDQGAYPFIRETIKKGKKKESFTLRHIPAVMISGILFGCCAGIAFASAMAVLEKRLDGGEEILLDNMEADPSNEQAGKTAARKKENSNVETVLETASENMKMILSEEASDSMKNSTADPEAAPMDIYASVYQDAMRIAEQPMKAMVRVDGISEDENLLDDSFLTYGIEEGVIFFNSEEYFYLLTIYHDLEKADSIRVTFCNGAVAEGSLCKADPRTGLAVIKVPLEALTEEEREDIAVASLSTSAGMENAQPVIGIGSPSGDFGSVVYGIVTSTSGKMHVADCEYSLFGTNIMGSASSSGVLISLDEKVIGIITRTGEDGNILKAISMSELRPLIEDLSNGSRIRYLGIHGAEISPEQSQYLNLPRGVYVKTVETDSPAMIAGIQNGDIVMKMNGFSLEDMETYMELLQNFSVGDKVDIEISRKSAGNTFKKMEFQVTIKEK